LPTTFSAPPAAPDFPPGLILWSPVVWFPEALYVLRPEGGGGVTGVVTASAIQTMPKGKWVAAAESNLADPWQHGEEWLVLPAKLRPALVVSNSSEHQQRKVARLMPLLRTNDDKGYYDHHEASIRAQDIPGLYWLDDVPIKKGVPESRVIDCSRVVRCPIAMLMGRKRVAVIDDITLAAIKQFWSESVVI
jgi:hypothetical protein